MIKMYEAEVLGKLPVIQHFLFGSLLPWDGPLVPTVSSTVEDECGHDHTTNLTPEQLAHIHPSRLADATHSHGDLGGAGQREVGWGDCCGIPVPSVFGAAQAEKEAHTGLRLGGPNIRPVPFD